MSVEPGRGVSVPIVKLGQRSIPSFCAKARFTGEIELLEDESWPGCEACSLCGWFRGRSGDAILCASPKVEEGPDGLSLEVDLFYGDGQKRRELLELSGDLSEAIRKRMKREGASSAVTVDLKFVAGAPEVLRAQSESYMERWRYYWNGESWIRKESGELLHDWNKWGRELEFVSIAEPGGMPPPGGWPPVLDLPEGRYLFRVVELRWAIGRRGERELEWVLRVLDGPHQGRLVFRRSPIRSEAMIAMLMRDLAMLLGQPEKALTPPEQPSLPAHPPPGGEGGGEASQTRRVGGGKPAFETQMRRVAGMAVEGSVRAREIYTNLYFNRLAIRSGAR